jgi:hypothetical protein
LACFTQNFEMQVTVQVAAEAVSALRQRAPPTPASLEVSRALDEFGVSLQPLDPDTDDPSLDRYFIVDLSDPAKAEAVVERLRQCRVVEGAYIKPREEAP